MKVESMSGKSLHLILRTLAIAVSVLFMSGCAPVYLVCDPDHWPNGTIAEVQAELNLGANVSEMINTDAIHTATPLHIAAKCNPDHQVAALLIEHGADVHAKDSLGNTPLYDATWNSDAHPEVVALLLEHGADPTAKAYYLACHAPQPCEIKDTTILYTAIYYPLGTSAARLLLEHGADVEINTLGTLGGYPRAPLHSAAAAGDPEEIRLLLEYGADVNLKDAAGGTPLHYAESADAVRLLIDSGANVNASSNRSSTPLHSVALYSNAQSIKLLLDNGADVNGVDSEGDTPLHNAMRPFYPPPNPEIIVLLLQRGADANSRNDVGRRPLHEAMYINSSPNLKDIIKSLLDHGADPNATDAQGNTPLHLLIDNAGEIARSQDIEIYPIIEMLLNGGANINARNEHGETPLHRAVWLNLASHKATQEKLVSEIIGLMLENGANLREETNYGMTPCEIAQEHEQDAAQRILCQ